MERREEVSSDKARLAVGDRSGDDDHAAVLREAVLILVRHGCYAAAGARAVASGKRTITYGSKKSSAHSFALQSKSPRSLL